MRILYCNKYNFRFSGTEAYLFDVMDLMREYGHEGALFSMADPRGEKAPHDQHFVPEISFKNPDSGPLQRVRLAAHAIYSLQARRRLRAMIAEFRPDVAHVRNIYHHLSPSILWELKAQGIPVLYHLNDFKLLCPSYNLVSHGQACERCHGGRFWHVVSEGCYAGPRGSAWVLGAEAYVHKWLRTYEKCVDLFLAPSQFVKDKLTANGWDANKIQVLPHFQQIPVMPPEPAVDAPILYFGRLSPEKGVTDLLRAMLLIPQVRLQIAGEGPQRPELDRLAQRLGLRNVEFLGYLRAAELEQRIAAAKFTVLPSRAYETFGKSIVESFAWGRTVVASDLGSRRELVEHNRTGLLFPTGDAGQMAKAISFLAEHPEKAAAMGQAGRELVRERFQRSSHYVALTQIYEQLGGNTTRPNRTQARRVSSPKLRVAFIGGRGVISKYSGIETYYEEAGALLAEMGHEITAYCRSHFTPSLNDFNGMRLVRLPAIRTKHLETLAHTALSTAHALFHNYDIVHYHALGPALFSWIPRLAGKKTVVTIQGQDWRRKKWGRTAAAVLRAGEWAALRLPNATMVVSQTLQQQYRELHGIETIYVPNGARIRRPTPTRVAKWGLGSDGYILYLGRFSPEKNCHLLVDAFEKIETHAKLVLAGGASPSDAYAQRLRGRASDRIRFLNWVSGDDLDDLLVNAMLFVLPSDLEGLSLALLDAMGAGVCVLASNVPENREVVEGAGFTFEQGNVSDLERMLRLLMADAPLRKAAGQKAQAKVRDRYLWPQIARQLDQAYRGLVRPTELDRQPPSAAVSSEDVLRTATPTKEAA